MNRELRFDVELRFEEPKPVKCYAGMIGSSEVDAGYRLELAIDIGREAVVIAI